MATTLQRLRCEIWRRWILMALGTKRTAGWVSVVVEAGRGWRAEAGDRVLSAVPLLAFDI